MRLKHVVFNSMLTPRLYTFVVEVLKTCAGRSVCIEASAWGVTSESRRADLKQSEYYCVTNTEMKEICLVGFTATTFHNEREVEKKIWGDSKVWLRMFHDTHIVENRGLVYRFQYGYGVKRFYGIIHELYALYTGCWIKVPI